MMLVEVPRRLGHAEAAMIEAKPGRAMQAFLGTVLRQTYRPEVAVSAIDARIADLCGRLDHIGGDRRAKPFCHDQKLR